MKVKSENHIILSRTNLENLLYMLDNRIKEKPAIVKGMFFVEVQEDEEHYGEQESPGKMSWQRGKS